MVSSCVDIESEILVDTAYPGDQLAVIGYLSNKGVVVNVQKTVPVENSSSHDSRVQNAKVYLYRDGDTNFKHELYKADDFNFFTKQDFHAKPGDSFYIEVIADGFQKVKSTSQVVMNESSIDSVSVEITTLNYWPEDTTSFFLFGWPRNIYITMLVNNSSLLINNCATQYFIWSGNRLYEMNDGEKRQFFYPQFYYQLGTGDFSISTPVNPISSFLWIDDQVETGDSVLYIDKKYPVLQRVDSVVVQFVTASDDFFEYFQKTNYYMENKISPFSSLSEKIPTNLSNGIGYFGNISITEYVIELPSYH